MFLYDFSFWYLAFTAIAVLLLLLKRLINGNVTAYTIILPIFLIFYVVPVYLDMLFEYQFLGPHYSAAAYLALIDNQASYIYNYYIGTVLLIFLTASYRDKKNINLSASMINGFYQKLDRNKVYLLVFLLVPIALAVLSKDYSYYTDYVNRARSEGNSLQQLASKMATLTMPVFAMLSVLCMHNIIKGKKISGSLFLILILLMLFVADVYIHGKRSSVASFAFFWVLLVVLTKQLTFRGIVLFLILIISLFYSFMIFYGKNIEEATSLFDLYKGLRIDLSRDYGTKFIIFHELLNDNYVLPYKGASLHFLSTFYIPREVWESKPYPYAVYVTNSFFGHFGEANLYGWGLTTSILMELVSNTSWLGLIIFPIFYIWAIKKIENASSLVVQGLGILLLVLLLVLHAVAILYLIMLFFVLLFFSKYRIVFR